MGVSNTGIGLIAKERARMITEEGYTIDEIYEHKQGELADAGALLAITDEAKEFMDDHWGNEAYLHFWRFELSKLKFTPEDRVAQLSRAGALIAAEIDRLLWDGVE